MTILNLGKRPNLLMSKAKTTLILKTILSHFNELIKINFLA